MNQGSRSDGSVSRQSSEQLAPEQIADREKADGIKALRELFRAVYPTTGEDDEGGLYPSAEALRPSDKLRDNETTRGAFLQADAAALAEQSDRTHARRQSNALEAVGTRKRLHGLIMENEDFIQSKKELTRLRLATELVLSARVAPFDDETNWFQLLGLGQGADLKFDEQALAAVRRRSEDLLPTELSEAPEVRSTTLLSSIAPGIYQRGIEICRTPEDVITLRGTIHVRNPFAHSAKLVDPRAWRYASSFFRNCRTKQHRPTDNALGRSWSGFFLEHVGASIAGVDNVLEVDFVRNDARAVTTYRLVDVEHNGEMQRNDGMFGVFHCKQPGHDPQTCCVAHVRKEILWKDTYGDELRKDWSMNALPQWFNIQADAFLSVDVSDIERRITDRQNVPDGMGELVDNEAMRKEVASKAMQTSYAQYQR